MEIRDDELTVSETARVLERSPERVRQLAREGRLPCRMTRFGRLFRPEDVMAFRRQLAEKRSR